MKKILALVLAALMLLSLIACSEKKAEEPAAEPEAEVTEEMENHQEEPAEEAPTEETEAAPTVITDLIGREVEVTCGSYERIVCIGAGALRMYSYVGDTALLCGVEDIDNLSLEERPKMFDGVARPYMIAYSDVFSTLPSCGVGGPNAQTAEAEKILSCKPDLVISEFEDVEKEDALQEQLGVPVITLRSGPKGVFDDCFAQSLKLLGTVLGKEDRAAELNAFITEQTTDISGRTADIADEDKPNVYICGLGNWGTTNHLMTSATYASFGTANVKNVVTELPAKGVAQLEEEAFVSLGADMDIMFMDAAAVKNIKPLYAEDNTMFDTCKAWQNGEVYLQMAFNAYYTNYELMLMNTWFIGKTVYPDAFADVDLTEKINEITQVFFHQDMAEEIYAFPSSFGGYQKIDTNSFFAE